MKATFTVNRVRINRVKEFKYLGRIIHASEDDSYAATRQLNRAREKWNRIVRILTAQGVESRVKELKDIFTRLSFRQCYYI